MALPSWTDLDKHALRASRRKEISPTTRRFFKTLHTELVSEKKLKRSSGGKQGLVSCIKTAMGTLIETVTIEIPEAESVTHRIEVPGLPRGKYPDYAIRRGQKIYLIEQKSILRFNEFSQVFLEALLAKRSCRRKAHIRFIGLFNYLHQEREAFEKLCTMNRTQIIDRLFVLIPDISYETGYDPFQVELMYKDIVEWLQ